MADGLRQTKALAATDFGACSRRRNGLIHMKQHEDAVHTLIRAILFKPDAHEAHLSRDDALRPLGQHAQALGSSTSHCHSVQASWPLVAIAV